MKRFLLALKGLIYHLLNWAVSIKRYVKKHIISVIKNVRFFLAKVGTYIGVMVKTVIEKTRFKNLLALICKLDLRFPGIITVLIVLIGILLNYLSKDKFPHFIIFQTMLLFTLCAAYYSIRKIVRFDSFGSNFLIHSAGDSEILIARIRYEKVARSSYNYITPIIFGGSISLITSNLLSVQINSILRIYCFSALGVILAVCAIGFSQYFFFVYFLMCLAKKADKIKQFDTALPAKTNWLVDLAKIANWYSTMYFFVGLIYILLFYEFSFSSAFGMQNLTFNERYPLYFLWGIIILVIIIGFPVTTTLGLLALRTITVRMKSHQETNLRQQRAITPDVSLQTSIDSLLILLNNTPSIPQKPIIGYIGPFLINAVNLFASIQAVMQFVLVSA